MTVDLDARFARIRERFDTHHDWDWDSLAEVERLARLGAAVVEDYAGWGDSTSWDIADFGKHVQQIVREHGYE